MPKMNKLGPPPPAMTAPSKKKIRQRQTLPLREEVSRLSEFKQQCSEKDQDIAALKEAKQLVRLAHKDEMINAQVESEGQGEDCMMRMEALIQELEDTKKTYMISAGTVCSLRRELSIKDRNLTLARAEGAELKQELKDRMAQLQAMSRKFSCLREGKANEELIAALENENCDLRQLTAQLKEEVSQKRQEAVRVSDEVQCLQKALEMERTALAKLQQRDQANQEAIAALHLQHSRAKVSLEQIRARFERLRGRIIQAAYSAPGAKPPQTELSDAALLQAMQKIVDLRLHQNGEKLPSLATVETQGVRNTAVSAEKQNPKT